MRASSLRDYLSVCRPDHWFKNVFMLAGTIAAVLIPGKHLEVGPVLVLRSLEAFALSCVAASANYVVNEILDAERDRFHPTKRHRVVPSGRVRVPILCGARLDAGHHGPWGRAQPLLRRNPTLDTESPTAMAPHGGPTGPGDAPATERPQPSTTDQLHGRDAHVDSELSTPRSDVVGNR